MRFKEHKKVWIETVSKNEIPFTFTGKYEFYFMIKDNKNTPCLLHGSRFCVVLEWKHVKNYEKHGLLILHEVTI